MNTFGSRKTDIYIYIYIYKYLRVCAVYLSYPDSSLLDPVVWKNYLYNIWFSPYTRTDGTMDSSGFEHVFLGKFH